MEIEFYYNQTLSFFTCSVTPLYNALGTLHAFWEIHVHKMFPGSRRVEARGVPIITLHNRHQVLVQTVLRYRFGDVIVGTDSKLVVSFVKGCVDNFCFENFRSIR